MTGKPSLSRSSAAAIRSPCALRNSRCVTSAGGMRICAIGTGRIFDGRRLECFVMGLPLHFEEPRDESAERFLRFNEGLGPRLKARAIYLSEVDQIDIRRQVFRVHDHLIDDSIRVRTASVSGRAVSWYVDFQIAHPL